jgi:hypothetical protein
MAQVELGKVIDGNLRVISLTAARLLSHDDVTAGLSTAMRDEGYMPVVYPAIPKYDEEKEYVYQTSFVADKGAIKVTLAVGVASVDDGEPIGLEPREEVR